MRDPVLTHPRLLGGPGDTIRTIRGHDVYRRPERCPTCGGLADLFLTGLTETLDREDVWSWLRPHPRCVVANLRSQTLTRVARAGSIPGQAFDLGLVRVATSLDGHGSTLRSALERHARPSPELGLEGSGLDLGRWCPGALEVQGRNALAILDRRGLVVSSLAGILILTGLDDAWAETVILPADQPQGLDLGPGLPAVGSPRRTRRPNGSTAMARSTAGIGSGQAWV